MDRRLVPLLAALCVLPPSFLAAQEPPESTTREILALHREINEAMFLRRDAAPLAQAALENLTVVPPGGFPETKEQLIRGMQNLHIDSIGYSEEAVQVHGNTAVLTAKLMVYGELHGIYPGTGQRQQVNLTGPYRQMSVYVKEHGRWRLLAQSTTPIRLPGATRQRP